MYLEEEWGVPQKLTMYKFLFIVYQDRSVFSDPTRNKLWHKTGTLT